MPTYDYKCKACGHRFEQFQSMSDKPLRKCPQCGKSALQRLIGTGAAVLFKGSGFYQTDYRSESYKKAAAAEKPSTDSGDSKKPADTTAKSDKPAASPSPSTDKPRKPSKTNAKD